MSLRAFLIASLTTLALAAPALAGNASVIVQSGGVNHRANA